jgi:very-short-patch-repair endonuclease
VETVDRVILSRGGFLRRRDLLPLGFTDARLRSALARGQIFRVRHGWYSVPGVDDRAVRAVRVGGRLTSLSALETFGLRVPRGRRVHVAVPPNANRLRAPTDRRRRLGPAESAIHWVDDRAGPSTWRVPIGAALLAVLTGEARAVAVACCSAALQKGLITERELDGVFDRAPARVHRWRPLVSALDESHGETEFRLRYLESGRACTQQVKLHGIGRFDFRVSPHVYVEIDGAQHDPSWTGQEHDAGSSWEHDLERDAAMAIRGDRVLHFGYRQLRTAWPTILAAIDRAVADDAALAARRRRHPFRPRAQQRKRRRSAVIDPPSH